MPNFAGTGPRGKGPMTGGSMGYCVIALSSPEQKLDFLINQNAGIADGTEAGQSQNKSTENDR